jgi:hypothetical protein
MLASLPSLTAVAALVGLAFVALRAWRADRVSLELSLAASLAVAILAWPIVCPPALMAFPGHWALALPYVGALAAFGVGVVREALAERFPAFDSRAFREGAALSVLLPALASSMSPSTASASFPLLSGGTRHAAKAHAMPLHDATPLGALAPAIDAAAHDGSSVYAPDVPADVLDWMARLGVHLRATPTAPSADVLLLTGDAAAGAGHPAVSASVTREGQDVLTLIRR